MTWVSICGVGIGVASLIVVLSVMGGFSSDLQSKLLKGKPHMEIVAKNVQAGFSLVDSPMSSFQKKLKGAESVEAFIRTDVVLKIENKLATAELFGVDPKRKSHLWAFDQFMVDGEISSIGKKHIAVLSSDSNRYPGIVLGSALAAKLGVGYGDKLTIVTPQSAVDVVFSSSSTFQRHYIVTGVFSSNLFKYDQSWAVVSLDSARKHMVDYDTYLDEEKFITGIATKISDPFKIDEYASRVQQKGLKTMTWKDFNKSYLVALRLEKYSMSIVLALIVLVAAFSISGTMAMTVYFRRGQIALLRSLGMTEGNLLGLYVLQGLFIGAVGLIIGLILGLGVCFGIYAFDFIELPQGVYYLKKLPIKFLPFEYMVICAGALLMTLLAALFPAFFASRQNTSSGLRFL